MRRKKCDVSARQSRFEEKEEQKKLVRTHNFSVRRDVRSEVLARQHAFDLHLGLDCAKGAGKSISLRPSWRKEKEGKRQQRTFGKVQTAHDLPQPDAGVVAKLCLQFGKGELTALWVRKRERGKKEISFPILPSSASRPSYGARKRGDDQR